MAGLLALIPATTVPLTAASAGAGVTAAGVGAAASAASALASIGSGIYGSVQAGKKPPDPMAKQRALNERLVQQRAGRGAIGQQATLLTGASGLTNPANVGKKTLLGG